MCVVLNRPACVCQLCLYRLPICSFCVGDRGDLALSCLPCSIVCHLLFFFLFALSLRSMVVWGKKPFFLKLSEYTDFKLISLQVGITITQASSVTSRDLHGKLGQGKLIQ